MQFECGHLQWPQNNKNTRQCDSTTKQLQWHLQIKVSNQILSLYDIPRAQIDGGSKSTVLKIMVGKA